VVVRFSRKVAQNVAEVAWHKTQRLEFRADGSLDFHVTVSGLGEISWWILGYGDQAEVVQPPELRRIVAGHAARMIEKYADQSHGASAPQDGGKAESGKPKAESRKREAERAQAPEIPTRESLAQFVQASQSPIPNP
jgi:hypothetical protein